MAVTDIAPSALLEFAKTINTEPPQGSNTRRAMVTRIDNGITYVTFPDGTEAPLAGTVSTLKIGDSVMVSMQSGRMRASENVSDPAASGDRVRQTESIAYSAAKSAAAASAAAEQAEADAVRAHDAANAAQESADAANASAGEAKASASAANYALSDVERVIGTLNWIAEHGQYVSQDGEAFDPSKAYYIREGESPDYYYTLVAEPVAEDVDSYYILAVDESIQNYIASHVYLTDDGLFVTNDSSDGYRVRIDGDSIDILDSNGIVVASFGAETYIGAKDKPICVKLTGDGMSFYPIVDGEVDTENPIASFVIQDGVGKLVVHNAVIMNELQFGNWKFMPRGNGNLALKWTGA